MITFELTVEEAFAAVADTAALFNNYSDAYELHQAAFYELYGDIGLAALEDEDYADDAYNALGALEYHAKQLVNNINAVKEA